MHQSWHEFWEQHEFIFYDSWSGIGFSLAIIAGSLSRLSILSGCRTRGRRCPGRSAGRCGCWRIVGHLGICRRCTSRQLGSFSERRMPPSLRQPRVHVPIWTSSSARRSRLSKAPSQWRTPLCPDCQQTDRAEPVATSWIAWFSASCLCWSSGSSTETETRSLRGRSSMLFSSLPWSNSDPSLKRSYTTSRDNIIGFSLDKTFIRYGSVCKIF